ncbi:peptidoglycan/xylan/chitin deacetylase (PgdA/CDA1 family) [Spirosoma lacussanchae]|uniref:polysaccharide deacetylase family protein n=1 Tax=Spirosoma lacussanchae TaxID=1884249 RepID=UPI001108B3F1|nr:polysaccharide deacetylase family protein [Spirosoma lacussanchae]
MTSLPDWVRRLKQSVSPSALVLMYHRIAEVDIDPWDLCVSPTHFEQHLQTLQKNYPILSVNELADQLQTGQLTKQAIVLTFDDGYADNFTIARPMLEKYGIPASFFLTTQPLLDQQRFWWDDLQQIICQTPLLPDRLSLPIADDNLEFELLTEARLTTALRTSLSTWKAHLAPPSRRAMLYQHIWEKLKPLPHHLQQQTLHALRCWSGAESMATPCPSVMTVAQVRELSQHSLIDVGGHTISHPALANHSRAVQQHEVAGGKSQLDELCRRSLTSFAYPYGNYNQTTRQVVEQAGFSIAFTTRAVATTRHTDRYQIGRLQIPDCTGPQLQKQINKLL